MADLPKTGPGSTSVNAPGGGLNADSAAPTASPVAEQPAAVIPRAMRALVADDDPTTAVVVVRALERCGLQVTSTDNGAAAWDHVMSGEPPDLLVVDWMMPSVDGIELCRRIRSEPASSHLYVILLTSRESRTDIVAGLDAGADDYVVKPFNYEELRARIRVGMRVASLQASLSDRVSQLQAALSRVKQLDGLLPICSYCKRIRSDQDYWEQLESYVSEHSEAQFSHGICPACFDKVKADFER